MGCDLAIVVLCSVAIPRAAIMDHGACPVHCSCNAAANLLAMGTAGCGLTAEIYHPQQTPSRQQQLITTVAEPGHRESHAVVFQGETCDPSAALQILTP